MMKKFKAIIAATLAAVTCASVCACGGEKEDPTKTYLDVGVFDAGLGTVYFDEMKKDFEAYYANESLRTAKPASFFARRRRTPSLTPRSFSLR